MFNSLLRRQCSSGLNGFSSILLKLPYSDTAVIEKEPKIKVFVEEDCSRIKKLEFKENFIEHLFLNRFQEKVLEYPQLDTIEEVGILKGQGILGQKLITGKTNNENALCEVDSKAAVATLKKHELTGFKIPRIKNGFGYLNTEYTYMQEALALDPSLSKTICEQEDFGIYLIDTFGSDLQKEQYLLKLVIGEKIACFANIEKETSLSFMPSSLKTTALLSSDNESYTISGTKYWVYNADSADVLILSAVVPRDGEKESKPTLFLVDKNTPGIKIHEPIKTIGLKNLSICNITFSNVVVPKTSVLGDVYGGAEIFNKALSQGKLINGGHYLGILKKLLKTVVQHCIHNKFFDKYKNDSEYFKFKIGKMASRLYALESMTYLLTGRLDSFTNSNVFLESLILKIYASETVQFFLQQTLEILGPEFFSSDDDLVNLSKDAQFYIACDDANDSLRVVLASAGLKYTMKYNKERSFWRFLSEQLSKQKFMGIPLQLEDVLTARKILKGYLHLMFFEESCMLEDAVAKLHEITMYLVNEYKDEVFERITELKYLADMVIGIYAMSATLGRASRAYCICVNLHEIDLICTEAEVRRISLWVRQLSQIIRGLRRDSKYSNIADAVLNCKKYPDLCPIIKSLTIR